MTSASRPPRETDEPRPWHLQLVDRHAESDTVELRPFDSADSKAGRTLGSDEPTVAPAEGATVATDTVRAVEHPGVDQELRAARAELKQLRTELAGLLNQVRRPDHHPDAPVSAPRPAPVTRPHVPLATTSRPAPATPSPPCPADPADRAPRPRTVPVRSAGTLDRPGPAAAHGPAPVAHAVCDACAR